MMTPMTEEMQKFFEKMNDKQKIRMFYELAVYINSNVEYEKCDKDVQMIIDDIANVINDVKNLSSNKEIHIDSKNNKNKKYYYYFEYFFSRKDSGSYVVITDDELDTDDADECVNYALDHVLLPDMYADNILSVEEMPEDEIEYYEKNRNTSTI